MKKLVGVQYTNGTIELNLKKKAQRDLTEGEKSTGKVSYMEVGDLFTALAYWIMLCDKHSTYIRRENMQTFWQCIMLI